MAPAILQRSPAKTPGETVEMPTFIASQVVPQTKQMKTNIARCDAVDEAFILVADVLLPKLQASASRPASAAPKRNGPYASGRHRNALVCGARPLSSGHKSGRAGTADRRQPRGAGTGPATARRGQAATPVGNKPQVDEIPLANRSLFV
jgi:hypothetical protein